jgi:hypothetical protein
LSVQVFMNKTLPALPGKAPALPPGAFEIGYTAHDGALHRIRLAEAAVVRFGDAQPTRPQGAAAPARALVVGYRRLPHRL